MSNIFAKLYERDGNQILVTAETNDEDKPVIKIMAIPQGLGLCSFSIGYKDTEEGFDVRDSVFEQDVTEDWAFEKVANTLGRLGLATGARDE